MYGNIIKKNISIRGSGVRTDLILLYCHLSEGR